MTKQQQIDKLNGDIETLRQLRRSDEQEYTKVYTQNEANKKRISDIAAENESLRADKKWFQQCIQVMLEFRPKSKSIYEQLNEQRPR